MASAAQAQRWGGHARVVVGVPILWPYWTYWHYPPYYYPHYQSVVVPADPVIYVEKGDGEPAASQDAAYYWYFCRDSNTYYPYVKQCASPWQRVVPQPPPR